MKRICIVKNSYYTGLTPERRNARALVSHGYEVDIICLKKKGEKSQEIIEGMKVYRLPVEHHRRGFFRYVFEYSAFFLMAFVKLAWLSLRRRYKVVQVSGIPHFLIFTAIVPRLLGAKVIFYILDHTPHVYMEHFGVGTSHRMVKLLNMFEGISARWADYCIGTQIINKQLLEKHGVPDDKISVILNVPDEGFSNNHDRIGSNNHHFSLITHGSLLERYGVQTLIKAVPLLTGEIPQLKVKIVGDGEYKRKLEELAHSLGVTKYIEFTGRVPPVEVPEYIAQADIGIVTIITRTNPMLPNKLFEYLDSGKPTISTTIPAITAYFNDDAVMFYEPGDEHDLARCVLELYKDPEKRATLAASGIAAYEKYRWKTMKNEYVKIFDRLTGS